MIIDDTAPDDETTEDGSLQVRFWRYGNLAAFRPLGAGHGGGAVAISQDRGDCGYERGGYVIWHAEGIPAGHYRVEAFIPDVDGLTSTARYDRDVIVDQAAHRGQWVVLFEDVAREAYKGYHVIGAQLTSGDSVVSAPCEQDVALTAFDALRLTLVTPQ